jgi:hypothetical protein
VTSAEDGQRYRTCVVNFKGYDLVAEDARFSPQHLHRHIFVAVLPERPRLLGIDGDVAARVGSAAEEIFRLFLSV